MKPFKSRRHQAGLTLVELSLAIGLSMAVAASAAGLFMVTQRSSTQDTLRDQLMQVAAAMSQMAANGQRSTISAQTIAEARLVPDSMVRGSGATTTLGSTAGGTFDVGETDFSSSVAARALYITVTGLDAPRCVDLAMSAADRFDEVRVGGLTGTTVKHALAATAVLPDRTDIATACDTGTDVSFLFSQ